MNGPKSGDNGTMASRKPFLLLGVLLAGCSTSSGQTGQPCSQTGAGACEGPDGGPISHLLVCRASDAGTGNVWEVYSDCRGTRGCEVLADSSLSCDTTGNTEGDRCAPESEGKARCDPSKATNILRCESGVLTKVFDCPAGCSRVDGGVSCL